jgi:succinate-semialdehyde dehydrogenase/glutarate-semialdehyde dehydrogenase
VGVVGVIAPWNYPLTMAISDAIPALLAGNAVVVKPAELTPFTALWAAEVLAEAGLPPGLLQVVPGDGPTLGPTLLAEADFVHFTGSTGVGRIIARGAAERLIGASLELGGKNPFVVLDDADLEKTIEGAVRACFSSAGQLCISAERLYVHRAVFDAFLDRFRARAESLVIGSAYDWETEMGSLASPEQLDKVRSHVEDAVAKGATAVTGGHPLPDLGPCFYAPTILTDAKPGMMLYAEETFGPVVAVYPFDTDDEAVALANDSAYGLNASVWTRDTRRGRALARRLRCGTVGVNDPYMATWGSTAAPMGGFGQSGLGRRHGPEGIVKYTEAQTVATQHLLPIAPLAGMAAGAFAGVIVGAFHVIRRLPGLR